MMLCKIAKHPLTFWNTCFAVILPEKAAFAVTDTTHKFSVGTAAVDSIRLQDVGAVAFTLAIGDVCVDAAELHQTLACSM